MPFDDEFPFENHTNQPTGIAEEIKVPLTFLCLGAMAGNVLICFYLAVALLIGTIVSKPANFHITKDEVRSYLTSSSCGRTAKILNEANGIKIQPHSAVADPQLEGINQDFSWTAYNENQDIISEGTITIHSTHKTFDFLFGGPKRTAVCVIGPDN